MPTGAAVALYYQVGYGSVVISNILKPDNLADI